MKISGQAAIVTGGGSGLGASTARRLAQEGAKVGIFDVNIEGAAQVAQEIAGLAIECDVTSAEAVETAIEELRIAHGPARIVINCAGISENKRVVGRSGPMPLDEHRRVIETHVVGTFNMVRLAVADMMTLEGLEQGECGVVINTSSVAAFDGQVGATSYAGAKAAIAGMTLPFAREFGPFGIRVVAIAPGFFETPMARTVREEVFNAAIEKVPFPNRAGDPKEFASLVIHICENRMINGEVIRLDGALRM